MIRSLVCLKVSVHKMRSILDIEILGFSVLVSGDFMSKSISLLYSSTEPFSRCSKCGESFFLGDVVVVNGDGKFHSRCAGLKDLVSSDRFRW